MRGADLIPKPAYGRLPIAVTGNSRRSVDWIAANADAWIMYPRGPEPQAQVVQSWRQAVRRHGGVDFKPFAQSLYIDLSEDPHAAARPIHLGFHLGRDALVDFLGYLQKLGVNHVILNLKYGRRPAAEVLEELSREVVSHFPAHDARPLEAVAAR
ncbi:MAG: hypothetical protein QOD83_360 [Solirubrobacteraceae bacterium]|nr:hypothetical protein [Solirubrobacteraceae bacterium]